MGIKLQHSKQYASLEPFKNCQKTKKEPGIFQGTQGWLRGKALATRKNEKQVPCDSKDSKRKTTPS